MPPVLEIAGETADGQGSVLVDVRAFEQREIPVSAGDELNSARSTGTMAGGYPVAYTASAVERMP